MGGGRVLSMREVLRKDVVSGTIQPDQSMKLIDNISTPPLQDPDLLIRTSGETDQQIFFSAAGLPELYFTTTLWPTFAVGNFLLALLE